ncbi:hypothetical protein [Diaphorobacter aerolatus]|uniref:Uncharacterized protein n=1 Tax=Diaphorobacter aerolatus TaxID=1288495 RepID=A0A7H0GQX2_9BURK|nr:hypothetical protein [Diaphorobacter aerolatus]QNP50688.1 hypothetical protein H9K75_00700 [Diaphorobacter aerolatus]
MIYASIFNIRKIASEMPRVQNSESDYHALFKPISGAGKMAAQIPDVGARPSIFCKHERIFF